MRIILLGSVVVIGGFFMSCSNTKPEESPLADISDIKTIEVRGDGHFDVTCINDRREVVGEADIMNENICLPTAIESGYYEIIDGHASYCKQFAVPNYNSKVLASLEITWAGQCSRKTITYTCSADVCSAIHLGTVLIVEPIGPNTYRYRGISGRWIRFKRTGAADHIHSIGTIEGDAIYG